MTPIRDVLIVGGGTAGWLTAAFLAKSLGTARGGIGITLVESSDIGIIGVGEGTFPSIRGTLQALGIGEGQFLRECTATFKQGIRFDGWLHPPGTAPAGQDHYFHPFSVPSQQPDGPELLPYWLLGAAGPDVAFAQAVTLQKRVADARRAPKRARDGDYQAPLNYAYHFDAARFAALLGTHARTLGVRHVVDTVERVELSAEGAISAVHTQAHGALRAQLYIDCSGFRGALIGGALGSPWRGVNDVLFADRALALQIPYEKPDAPIASYTLSTAQEAGWIWDIGLQQRRGLGYVYSSCHTDDARAEAVLRAHAGPAAAALTPRKLQMRVGYRETPWVANCVAVGLAGGFLEPLEASGIGLVETAAYLLAYAFPFDGNLAPAARQFNALMRGRYERIVDFIKMHYCLTQRRDTAFWRDNADPASIPSSLQEKLAMWRCRPPHRLDFVTDLEMYLPASWQFVLYGMHYPTRLADGVARFPHGEAARREFAALREVGQRALHDLPDHRALVEALCAAPGGAAAIDRAA